MADLCVWLIQQTALDLLMRPLNRDDAKMIEEELPQPMYPGEWAREGGVPGQLASWGVVPGSVN